MKKETKVISWDGWNYYQTPKGKLKKFKNGEKVQDCGKEEFTYAAKKYAEIFGW